MRAIVFFPLFLLAAANIDQYTVDDHLDIESLVRDVPKLQSYVDCFLDRTPCSEVAYSYKRIMHESVQEACLRCNANQKYQFWRFLEGVRVQLPEDYIKFKNHYDPDNKYFDVLLKEISKYTTRV